MPGRRNSSQAFSRSYRSARLGHEKCYVLLLIAPIFLGEAEEKVRYRARYLAMHRSGVRKFLWLPLSALLLFSQSLATAPWFKSPGNQNKEALMFLSSKASKLRVKE